MAQSEVGQWYVVYSKPHKEEVAEFHLLRKGVEVFFPRLLLPQSLPKRQQLVPLFPNYLFVRIQEPEEFGYARWSPGVSCLVSFNGTPAPLDDAIVTFLKQRATPEGILTARSTLRVGQQVQITRGPFSGLVGVIENPPDAKGRVRVLMQLLSRQVKVDVPVHFIETGWAVAGQEGQKIVA